VLPINARRAAPTAPSSILTKNIADSEVLNEVSQIVLKIDDFVCDWNHADCPVSIDRDLTSI
jgi:hypothetical protein